MGEWLVALTVQRYPQLFCNIFDCLNNVRERKTCNLNVNVREINFKYSVLILLLRFYLLLEFQCIQTRIGFGAFFATICNHISKYLKSPEFYDMTLQSLASLTLSQHVTVRIYSQAIRNSLHNNKICLSKNNIKNEIENICEIPLCRLPFRKFLIGPVRINLTLLLKSILQP